MENMRACIYPVNGTQYSAVETDLACEILPFSTQGGMMGNLHEMVPCARGDSVWSTVLAVVENMRKVGSFVHMGSVEDADPHAIMDATSMVSDNRVCVVFVVNQQSADSTSFKMYATGSTAPTSVDEGTMVKIIGRLQRGSETFLWYWYSAVVGYSFILNPGKDARWAVMVGERAVPKAHPASVASPNRGHSSRPYSVMPFFYSGSRLTRTLVIGAGSMNTANWSDLSVNIEALSELVSDRVFCARTSSGRCFCCEYITRVHVRIHFPSE